MSDVGSFAAPDSVMRVNSLIEIAGFDPAERAWRLSWAMASLITSLAAELEWSIQRQRMKGNAANGNGGCRWCCGEGSAARRCLALHQRQASASDHMSLHPYLLVQGGD